MQPTFINISELEDLKKKNPNIFIDDQIDLAIDELFDIENPEKKDTKSSEEVDEFAAKLAKDLKEWGNWIYYPWLNRVVHFPPEKEFYSLRTSRNRNLITREEQLKIRNTVILIAGMSVGSNVVEAVVSQGIGKKLILADMDIIEPSNLNRIRAPYYHVGLSKVDSISRKVWEVDPYVQIKPLKNGLSEKTLAAVLSEEKIDVLVDEVDDLRIKVIMREYAQRHKLPVIMAADDGDNILLDIERYDLSNENRLPFNGKVPADIIEKIKEGSLSRPEIGMLIGKYFVGVDNTPLRMFRSLSEVGKTLPSWPQLGGAATLAGVTLAYTIRKIILKEDINEGSFLVSIDDVIDKEHLKKVHIDELERFKEMLG